MKKLIAILAALAVFAVAGSASAQDKDKAPEKAAAEAKQDDAKKEAPKAEAKKEEAKPAPTPNGSPGCR